MLVRKNILLKKTRNERKELIEAVQADGKWLAIYDWKDAIVDDTEENDAKEIKVFLKAEIRSLKDKLLKINVEINNVWADRVGDTDVTVELEDI